MLMKNRNIPLWFVYYSDLKHANPNMFYLLKIIKNVKKKKFFTFILDR